MSEAPPTYTVNAPDPEADIAILLKALHHMVNKAKPINNKRGTLKDFKDGTEADTCIGYRVTKREFERVRSKLRRLNNG